MVLLFARCIVAQPKLELLNLHLNLDTIPQRIIEGRKIVVIKVEFKNVGNMPMSVEEISTIHTE